METERKQGKGLLWFIGFLFLMWLVPWEYISMIILIFFSAILFFTLLLYIAGPGGIPQYTEVKEKDGTVLYYINGFLTPMRPEPKPFLDRLIDMDGLHDGAWDRDRGMGADG